MKLSLWPACVRNHSFEQQLAAASSSGFTHLPIGLVTYRQLIKQGLNDTDIIQLAAAYNVKLGHYDGFSDWAPVRYNDDLPDAAKEVFNASSDECLEICNRLGIDSICATGTFDYGQFPIAQLADGFAQFCQKADQHGVRVDLEFLPMWGVRDLETAWAILREGSPSNGSLMIDSWHFYRSSSSLDLLRSLPAGAIHTIQLADADQKLKSPDLFEDCLLYRRLPGQGELDLAAFIDAIRSQPIEDIGPEIFSLELDQLSASESASRCFQATIDTLQSADWELAP